MKKLLFLIFLLPSLLFAQVETYYITFVKGQAIHGKTLKQLKAGDKILSSDKVIFKTSSSSLGVISPKKGRFVINANQVKSNSKGEFIALIENTLNPFGNVKKLSTRSGNILNINDLKTYFKNPEEQNLPNQLLIIGEQKVYISEEAFPMNNQNFFFIKYEYKGEKINKKLASNIDTLLLNEEIFTIDGKNIEQDSVKNLNLYYLDKSSGKSIVTEIGQFNLKYLSTDQATTELNTIKKFSDQSNKSALQEVLYSHIRKVYGKPIDLSDFYKWLEQF